MGRADQAVARTDSVRIKLAPAMVERLERLALDFGMPVSTMGAFAIGSWINQQEQTRLISEKTVSGFLEKMGEKFDPAMFSEALGKALPAVVTAMADRGFVLDHETASKPDVGAS